jgi:hypothetical protein
MMLRKNQNNFSYPGPTGAADQATAILLSLQSRTFFNSPTPPLRPTIQRKRVNSVKIEN